MTPHYWFRKKRWGYGWTPCSREGWTSSIVALAIVIGAAFWLALKGKTVTMYDQNLFTAVVVIDVSILLLITIKKGEPLR